MKIRANLAIGAGLTVLALAVGIFGPWLAHTDPIMDANLMNAELPPSREFWFGTDQQGRDIWSRVMYGAQISLTVGVVSQFALVVAPTYAFVLTFALMVIVLAVRPQGIMGRPA